MKITKQLANDLAKMLTQKKDKAIDKARKDLTDFADKIYLKTIPKEVILFFEKNEKYMNSTNYMYVSGFGIGYEHVKLSKRLPSKESTTIQPTIEECKKLRLLLDNHNSLKNKKQELMCQTENALLTLSTSKRVIEQFPELTDFLNRLDGGKLVPVANIENLKKELKKD